MRGHCSTGSDDDGSIDAAVGLYGSRASFAVSANSFESIAKVDENYLETVICNAASCTLRYCWRCVQQRRGSPRAVKVEDAIVADYVVRKTIGGSAG